MINEITHADASARVDKLRGQLASIGADLTAATQARDNHECEAVLAGAEIDASFRTVADELQVKHSVTSNLIRTLEVRVEAMRQKEADAVKATKRAAAEELVKNLMAQQHEKASAAVAAVLACNKLFREASEIRGQIRSTISIEFPGEERPVPVLPPSGAFIDELALDSWAESACEFGYAECIPALMAAKRRFLAKKNANLPPDPGSETSGGLLDRGSAVTSS